MSNQNPDTERRPRPGGETRVEERSIGNTALHFVESVGSDAKGALVSLAVTSVALKAKGKLGSKGDSHSKSNSSSDANG